MEKPKNVKDYKGYKNTWATNISLFDQKKHKPVDVQYENSTIKTKGSDKINDYEKDVVGIAVSEFNIAEEESKKVKPLRTFNIRKPV